MNSQLESQKRGPNNPGHGGPRAQPILPSQGSVQRNVIASLADVEASRQKGSRRKQYKTTKDVSRENEALKKTRGRPRMDETDASTGERRRAQVRLAQRAYRNRKETTIASLETQVQRLRNINEKMSNAFMNLYDYAIEEGLAAKEPQFARRLQSTTEQFLALANAAGDFREDEEVHDCHNNLTITSPKQAATATESDNVSTNRLAVNETHSTENPVTAPWGYQITRGIWPFTSQSVDPEQTENNQLPSAQKNCQANVQATSEISSLQSYSIKNLQQNSAEVQNHLQHTVGAFDTFPFLGNYGSTEAFFVRRLARTALEIAWKLINFGVHSEQYYSVFGVCLHFESMEDIKAKLQLLLTNNESGPLTNFRGAYIHGSPGINYPIHDPNINEALQPKSMGPHLASVNAIRDSIMEDGFMPTLVEFANTFFDPSDVEGYLRGMGIEISPNADFVDVDLDQLAMHHITSSDMETKGTSAPSNLMSSRSTKARSVNTINSTMSGYLCADLSDFEDNYTTFVSLEDNSTFPPTTLQHKKTPTSKLPPEARAAYDVRHASSRKATISVETLIAELLRSAKCLGRGPGFLLVDVDAAVKRTVAQAL